MTTTFMKWIMVLFSILLLPGVIFAQSAGPDREKVKTRLAADVLTDSVSITGVGIPKSIFRDAYGVAIFPNIHVAGRLSTDHQAEGVAIIRTVQGGWSGPAFVKLAGDDLDRWSAQGTRDVMFVFNTAKFMDEFMRGELSMRDHSGDFRAFKREDTAFTDLQITGVNISFDSEANGRYYGAYQISPEDIFTENVPSDASDGNPLTCLMASFSGTTQLCRLPLS